MVTPETPLSSREKSGVKQFGVAVLSAAALAVAAGCVSPHGKKNATASEHAHKLETSPAAAPVSSEKKIASKEDEDIILLTGFIVCEPEFAPKHKPGRSGN